MPGALQLRKVGSRDSRLELPPDLRARLVEHLAEQRRVANSRLDRDALPLEERLEILVAVGSDQARVGPGSCSVGSLDACRTQVLYDLAVAMLLEPLGRVRVVQIIVDGKEEKR